MTKGTDRMMRNLKQFADLQYKQFSARHGQQLIDILEFPIKLVLSPFTLAYDIAGSAPRGFGIPEFISKLSFSAIFVVATLGTYDIALDLGKKVLCQRNCRTCNGWQALRCTMCRGSGKVQYQVKNFSLKSGEKATAESVADAIADNRAELVHLPSTVDLHLPLPSKDCPTCDGSGVMGCPECKNKLQIRISADDIMEPPWTAYNILRKMHYPYEHIVHSMKDPSIAAFWLLTMPQIVGGFNYDDEVKQKIWWQYKESMRYDQLRAVVAKRIPGWEHLQEALISIDPVRAREDPVVVKNVPYYKARKALEAEVMKLNPPPRPQNWGDDLADALYSENDGGYGNLLFNGWEIEVADLFARTKSANKFAYVHEEHEEAHCSILNGIQLTEEYWQELNLPLNASSWSEEDHKDPKKLYEMTVLLNAQREIADQVLDAQWQTKWRQEKLNEMLKEKVQPYIQSIDNGVLSQPIIIQSPNQDQKGKTRKRRWWLF